MEENLWHFYAEIYFNGSKSNGVYKHGSGVVKTRKTPKDFSWYDELRDEILDVLGASTSSKSSVNVISLTKL